jgi:hypothetical protein
MTRERPKPTKEEMVLFHILYIHIMDEMFASFLIARDEAQDFANEDPRFKNLFDKLGLIGKEIMSLVEETLDEIPSALSMEEAKAKIQETIGLPFSYIKPEVLH